MKCFIIHLPKIETSLNSALKLKKQLEDFNHEVIMLEGSPGDETQELFKKQNRNLHGDYSKDPNNKYVLKSSSPGVKGCFYSHYRCWQECVKLNEDILIFEDDVVLIRNLIPIKFKEVLIVASSHVKKMITYMNYLKNHEDTPMAKNYDKTSMPGAAGYIIKPVAAKKLIEFYKESYLPADNAIHQSIVKIEIHNCMMGAALSKHQGNVSNIKTDIWNKNKRL